MEAINQRVKQLRLKLDLTQGEFGDALGLSKSGISNIENGTRSISKRHIKLICNEFGVSESWLETGNEPIFTKDVVGKLELFTNYLSSLGYAVKIHPACVEGEEIIFEEMRSRSGNAIGTATVNDSSGYIAEIYNGKFTAEFTPTEFEELQAKFIELQKKVNELQADNQAIIEMRIQKQAKK